MYFGGWIMLVLLPKAAVKLLQLMLKDGNGLNLTELIDTGFDAEKWHCLIHVGNSVMKQVTDILLFVISRTRYGLVDFLQYLYIYIKQIVNISTRVT